MTNEPLRATIATRYGDATYSFKLDANGSVAIVAYPLEGLPDTVYQMTYGRDWRDVKDHFRDLGTIIPDWVGAYLTAPEPPGQLLPVIELCRRHNPSPPPAASATFWSDHPEWRDLFHPDKVRRNHMLSSLTGTPHREFREVAAPHLEGYLRRLTEADTLGSIAEAYRLLGSLGTDAARQLLLGELERDGRHPYARHLLFGLEYFREPEVLERIRQVYRKGNIPEDDLPAVLRFLRGFRGDATLEFLQELLSDHAFLSPSIVEVMHSINLADRSIHAFLWNAFEGEKAYHNLDILLRSLNALSTPKVTLEEMNDRAAAPAFTDVPPVNWPQQLEAGWTGLVRTTPLEEAQSVMAAYLGRSEPRLQRNALLQFKVLIRRPDFDGSLPVKTEERLRELLQSRFDKIYVEALNIMGDRRLEFTDKPPTLDAILRLSLRTRYRIVVLKALRRIGDFAGAHDQTRRFLERAMEEATTPGALEHLSAFLPYVEKYLGDVTDLRERLEQRLSEVAD